MGWYERKLAKRRNRTVNQIWPPCLTCGKTITGHKRRWCNRRCRETFKQGYKCELCGVDFLAPIKSSRSRALCSYCHALAGTMGKRKKMDPDCEWCGGPVPPGRIAYCSWKCMNSKQMSKKRNAKRTTFIEEVPYIYIYNRDGGVCQLCNKKVHKKHLHPHLMCGTLDHIIPASKGGEHSRKNVQLAHLTCNCVKNNAMVGQLRLFG